MEELLTHMNNNHSDNLDVREHLNSEDLYSCDFCGLTFGILGGLRNHIRSQRNAAHLGTTFKVFDVKIDRLLINAKVIND